MEVYSSVSEGQDEDEGVSTHNVIGKILTSFFKPVIFALNAQIRKRSKTFLFLTLILILANINVYLFLYHFPQISIKENLPTIDEKNDTITTSGEIKNLTYRWLGPLQANIILESGEYMFLTDRKLVFLEPMYCAPGGTAKYKYTIPRKHYSIWRVVCIINDQKELTAEGETIAHGVDEVINLPPPATYKDKCVRCHGYPKFSISLPSLIGITSKPNRTSDDIIKLIENPSSYGISPLMPAFPELTYTERKEIADWLSSLKY